MQLNQIAECKAKRQTNKRKKVRSSQPTSWRVQLLWYDLAQLITKFEISALFLESFDQFQYYSNVIYRFFFILTIHLRNKMRCHPNFNKFSKFNQFERKFEKNKNILARISIIDSSWNVNQPKIMIRLVRL